MRRAQVTGLLFAALGVGAVFGTANVAIAQMQDETLRVVSRGLNESRGRPDQGVQSPASFWNWPIYDSLTMVDLEGEAQPLLATSWRNIDTETWHFSLRPNVTFQNQEPFNADSVISDIEYTINGEGKGTTSGRNMTTQARIASIRKIDDLTIEIKTKGPNPILPKAISGNFIPAPKAYADQGNAGFANNPIGTGSYRLVEWNAEGSRLEAFGGSWRPAKIKHLTIVSVPERTTRVQAIISDQADIAIGLSIDNIDSIEGAGHTIGAFPRPSVMAWQFMSTLPDSPFRDPRVRMAANIAIDRDVLNTELLRGLSRPASQCAAHFAFGYNPNIKPYPFDPDRAKKLLAEAGYPNGFEVTAEVVPGAQTGDNEIYQAVAQQLSSVGIRVKLEGISFGVFLKKWFPGADATRLGFEGMFQNYCNDNNVDGLDAFSNSSCRKNPPYYCDQDEMKLIEAAAGEFDEAKRRKAIQDLLALNHENAGGLYMVEVIDVTGVHKRVKGFKNVIQRLNYHEVTIEQ